MFEVRPAQRTDDDAVWAVLEPVICAGDTYALPPDLTREAALSFWHAAGNEVFVVEVAGTIAATYFLKPNQKGGGAHVANCGYITSSAFAGRGIARAMCLHSLARAKERGFRAMQFNFVISTNTHAVKLWKACGFDIVGILPGAFLHPQAGYVDVFVMHRNV